MSSRRTSTYAMISVEEAIAAVLRQSPVLALGTYSIGECSGLVIAEDIKAMDPFPAFPASIMDGYAVRGPLEPGIYPVMKRIHAGDDGGSEELKPGMVCYITTGARVPPGANAVVKVEDTESVEGGNSCNEVSVRIKVNVDEGTNVRAIGCDIQSNELILKKGQIIRSAEIGLLATVGVVEVKCYSKPIIGVLSTGNELLEINMKPNPASSQIRDSNRVALLAAFASEGYQSMDLGIVKDVKTDLESSLLHAATLCDVVVTSGGVSMGDADFVKPLLESLGTVHFGRLNMKPGKPTTFASIIQNGKKTLFFGLPGNPVSCLVTKALMIDPALRRMQGLDSASCMHVQVPVKISTNLKLDHERPEYHRAIVSLDPSGMGLVAVSTGNQASSRLMSLCSSNALLCLPQQQGVLPAGSIVQALLTGNITTPSPASCYHKVAASLDYPVENKSENPPKIPMRVGILTVSDRASQGVYKDEGGPEIAKILANMSSSDWQIDAEVVSTTVVPDDISMIQSTLVEWSDSSLMDVILTTGGTGFGIRDFTPEAVKGILHREAPSLAQALIDEGLKHTPLAVLSRPVAGTRNSTLICTLPGSIKAIRENMVALKPLLPRIVELLLNRECGVLANTPGYGRK